jgi:hypothetical protein
MADIHEQHINIKYCFKLGKTFMETHEMMKNIYGDQRMSHTCCCGLNDLSTVGSQHMTSRVCDGPQRRDGAHVAQVHEIMCCNHRLIVQEIAEKCNISIGSCHNILMTKLEMHQLVSEFVPQLLTQDHRHIRFTICQEFWIVLARMKTYNQQ